MNGKEERIRVFEDTERKIAQKYTADVEQSVFESLVFIPEVIVTDGMGLNLYQNQPDNPVTVISTMKTRYANTKYIVNKSRSFEAAEDLLDVMPGARVAVLNFASAKHPGGMVTNGSAAQEEALCRVSTLYNVISNKKFKKVYYDYHLSQGDSLYSDRVIYSPYIKIIKDDDFNDLSKPYTVDVITCAAPNLIRRNDISDQKLFEIQYSRCLHIIKAAAYYEATVLVLGAFGCGVFQNNPKVVAEAMKKALEDSPYKFDRVIFPIFCREWETDNYDAFREVFIKR